MNIPDFAPHGALPPFIEGKPTEQAARSPYVATMHDFVERFCTNVHRAKMLIGLNEYRKHLFHGGFVSGVQWLDGSFSENVEVMQKRHPNDIDIVTLFKRPIKYQINPSTWSEDYEAHLHTTFFATKEMKPKYSCDTYSIDLDVEALSLVRRTTYWFGLFSDMRGSIEKKGIVEIPLANDPMEFAAINGIIGGKFSV